MATLIDYVRHFQRSQYRYELRSDAIALYYTLLEIFNSARFPETMSIRTDILQNSAGIITRDKFYEARNVLKMCGLIEFQARRGKINVTYSLPISDGTQPNSAPIRRFISDSIDNIIRPQTRPRAREIGEDNGSISKRPARRF